MTAGTGTGVGDGATIVDRGTGGGGAGDRAVGEVRLLRWGAEDQAAFLRFTGAMTALHARIRETWGGEPGLPVPRPPEPPTQAARARALLGQGRAWRTAMGSDAELFALPERDVLLALLLAEEAAEEAQGPGGCDAGSLATLLDLPRDTVSSALTTLARRGFVAQDGGTAVLLPPARMSLSAYLAAI